MVLIHSLPTTPSKRPEGLGRQKTAGAQKPLDRSSGARLLWGRTVGLGPVAHRDSYKARSQRPHSKTAQIARRIGATATRANRAKQSCPNPRVIQLSVAIHGAIDELEDRLSPGHRTYRGSRSAVRGPPSSQVAGEFQITARRPSPRSLECVASRAKRMDEC